MLDHKQYTVAHKYTQVFILIAVQGGCCWCGICKEHPGLVGWRMPLGAHFAVALVMQKSSKCNDRE